MDKIISEIKTHDLNKKERPSWDEYFMSFAYLTSLRSSCVRLHVGCVLVKDNRIISTGYNGHLPNTPHTSIVRDGHEQMTVHAESNAITDAAKRGVSLNDATAYVTHLPCLNCCKVLVASGIKKIIYGEEYKNDELVSVICNTSNVQLIKF
jgi:dCMP deaminase